MILGTSAYKLGYRATVFEPVTEAGWGILAGMGKPGARRSFYVNNDQAAGHTRAIEARAAAGTPPPPTLRPARRRRAGRRRRHLAARRRSRVERDALERLKTLRPVVTAGGTRPAHRRAVRLPHHHRADRPPHRRQDRQPARRDDSNAITERNRNRGGG